MFPARYKMKPANHRSNEKLPPPKPAGYTIANKHTRTAVFHNMLKLINTWLPSPLVQIIGIEMICFAQTVPLHDSE